MFEVKVQSVVCRALAAHDHPFAAIRHLMIYAI